MSIRDAERLLEVIDLKLASWDERSQFKLGGVGNLSRSDLDTLQLYAETYINNGGRGFEGLMKPLGDIRLVLEKHNLV